jgi:citrate synthase
MQPWRTAIVKSTATGIWIRGHDITSLMRGAGFVDTVFLLHRGRLPTGAERDLLDALLIAAADHGAGAPSCATARLAASGNRESLSAAVAAGILAIGDVHGGAGAACMEIMGALAAQMERDASSLDTAAGRLVDAWRAEGRRIPGLGHRVHTIDPRVDVLFTMARAAGVAGHGVAAMLALEAAVASRVKPMPINIDGAFAAILYDLGFEPAAGKLLFIVGRVAGLTAEVAEEHAREKPMRIRIPVEYDGEPAGESEGP